MQKVARVMVACVGCGKEVGFLPSLLKKPVKYGHFCSKQCRSSFLSAYNPAMQQRRIETSCAFCNAPLFLQPYRIMERNFCSHSCQGRYGLKSRWPDGVAFVDVTCAQCAAVFSLPAWEQRCCEKRGQSQFFCNRQCFGAWKSVHWRLEHNPSWKGGWSPHGKGWAILCNQVRHEQKYRCADCRVTEQTLGRALDVHHIIAARFFPTDQAASIRSNLIALCHTCHVRHEKADLPLFAHAKTPPRRTRKQKTENLPR